MPQTVNLLDPAYYSSTQSVPGLNLASLARATDQDVNQGFYGAPIEDYIRSLGFSGPMAYHYERPATAMEEFKGGSNDRHIVSGSSQELRDWMAKNGYSLNQSIDDKNVRTTMTDANGNVLKDYGYDNTGGVAESLARLGVAAGFAYGGYNALGGLGGAEASAGLGGEGIGTLGAGGTSAGQFVAQPLTGLGAGGGLSDAALSLTKLSELGYAIPSVGASALDPVIKTLGAGGTSVTPFTPSPLTGMGANAGLAEATTSLGKLASQYAPGALQKLVETGAKSAGSSLLDSVKEAATNPLVKYGLPALGAIAGAADAGKGSEASVSSQIDPRMAQYLYGTGYGDPNSLLGAAQALWKQNPSGINSTMQQGLDMARAALTNPAYAQAFTSMRDVGSGLLNTQVAGNPFTQGRAAPSGLLGNGNTGIVPPNIPAPDVGLPTMKALPYRGPGLL